MWVLLCFFGGAAARVQGGWASAAVAQEPHPAPLPHAHLRPQPCGGQVPLLVLCVPTQEDEEGVRRDRLLRTGPREDAPEGEELWHLASLRLAQRHAQHVPRVPGPHHLRSRHPVLPRHGRPAPRPRPLHSDHEGSDDRRQQVSQARHQAVPRLQDQVPAAPSGPAPPAQTALHHQETKHLLLKAVGGKSK